MPELRRFLIRLLSISTCEFWDLYIFRSLFSYPSGALQGKEEKSKKSIYMGDCYQNDHVFSGDECERTFGTPRETIVRRREQSQAHVLEHDVCGLTRQRNHLREVCM